jgi:hypothetical protein
MDFTYHSDICRSVYIFHTNFFYLCRNARALTIVFTPPLARTLSPLEARNFVFRGIARAPT